jgi:dihydroceramidase
MLKLLTAAALAALLVSILAMAALWALPPAAWEGWPPATCRADHCFCEAANPLSPVRQPANTVSSLVYLFPGFAIALLGRRSQNRFVPAYAAIVGAAALVTGLGSALYHASLTLTGQYLDILGMLLLASFMLVYALERSLGWSVQRTLALYAAAMGLFTLVQVGLPDTRRYLFALVLLAALLLEYRLRLAHPGTAHLAWLNSGVALLALAFFIWILDQTAILCDPASLLQGHAVWHLLGAAGMGLLYAYYHSET